MRTRGVKTVLIIELKLGERDDNRTPFLSDNCPKTAKNNEERIRRYFIRKLYTID